MLLEPEKFRELYPILEKQDLHKKMIDSIFAALKTFTLWFTLIIGGTIIFILENNINEWYENEKKIILTTEVYSTGSYGAAICKDGVYSGSKGQGTCSWHGGIAKYAEISTPIPNTVRMEVLYEKYSNKYFWLRFFSVFVLLVIYIYSEKIEKILTYEIKKKK